MPYSITCLAIAPFLVPGVYILLFPQEEEIHYCTHSAVHSSKRFKPLFTSCYYACKVVVELEKIQTRNSFSCVIMLGMK